VRKFSKKRVFKSADRQSPAQLAKKGIVIKKGKVLELLPGGYYRVALENGEKILAHISGRMRQNFIRVFPGDEVKLEMSEHDFTKGRIVYRFKQI